MATISLGGNVPLVAISPGTWGNALRVRIDYHTDAGPPAGDAAATSYNLTVLDTATGAVERYLNISTTPTDPQSLDKVLSASQLIAVPAENPVLNKAPDANPDIPTDDPDQNPFSDSAPDRYTQAQNGTPGGALDLADYLGGATGRADKLGIYQLYKTDIFNMLCLPGAPQAVMAAAAQLCVDRRAMLLVDPPSAWSTVASAVAGMATPPVSGDLARNAALYFPNVQIADPSQNGITVSLPPCGTVAGVVARSDVQRGVWTAPAGRDASLTGVSGLSPLLTDADIGQLNPLGVNCLRSFPLIGPVVWGARTLRGADRLAHEWKYLPVRRLALFIEESLSRGTQWVEFETNGEALWASIRMNVGAFMNALFRQGAFQGATPPRGLHRPMRPDDQPSERRRPRHRQHARRIRSAPARRVCAHSHPATCWTAAGLTGRPNIARLCGLPDRIGLSALFTWANATQEPDCGIRTC